MATAIFDLKAPDAVRLWSRLQDFIAELRGFDIAGSTKGPRIPRSTNADVILMLQRWTTELILAGVAAQQKSQWQKIVKKWETAASEMNGLAKSGPLNEQFPDNLRFWNATKKLAIELGSLKAIPGKWTLAFESLAEAVPEAPRVITDAVSSAGKKVVQVGAAVAGGAGKVVGAAGKGLAEGLGIGVLAIGAGAIYLFTRKKRG